MTLTNSKKYELFNKILLGLLAIEYLDNTKYKLISSVIPDYELAILQLIIITRIIAFNIYFKDVINYVIIRRINRAQLTGGIERNNEEQYDIRIEHKIFITWLSVLELVIFTVVYLVKQDFQPWFIILGMFMSSYREITYV